LIVSAAAIIQAVIDARALPVMLAAARADRRIGRTELARALDCARMTLWRWERGDTTPSSVELFCWAAALGIKLGVTDTVTVGGEA